MEVNVVQMLMFIATLVATFAIVRYQTNENKKDIEALCVKIETHGEAIVSIRTKQESSITAKEVSEHYLSKEHFRQFEKHIDDKFKTVIDGQGKILEEVQRINRG